MINLQPTLIGKIVKIRPLQQNDLENLVKAASDPLLWAQHPEPKRFERDYFIEKYFQPAMASKSAVAFENKDGEIIGCSRYALYRPLVRDIEIGYTWLERKYWGSTYNREIKHLMLTHIFQYVDTVLFIVGNKNIRSQKAVERIGGKLISKIDVERRKIPNNEEVVFEIEKKNFKGLL